MDSLVRQDPATPNKSYWETYYSQSAPTQAPIPSQFGVFVLGELHRPHFIVDLGCGTGRDALFFATNGHAVVGVDASHAAIDRCTALSETLGTRAEFLCSSVADPDLPDLLKSRTASVDLPTLAYARFFVHAITEAEEILLFQCIQRFSSDKGLVALEFRTIRDAEQSKETGAHYRRFIDPLELIERTRTSGFVCRYFVEGFGFAKYKNDDAHVARCIFERTR